jgi:hypothetical protein
MTDGRRPRDRTTRATRLAANAAVIAVVAWAILFLVTKQIPWVEAASPYANDPWDIVTSYAAIFLPIVVGATFVRSIRHRGQPLEPATARRIRTGVAMSLLTIGLNVASDALALLVVPLPEPVATTDGRLALIIGLVAATGLITLLAGTLLVRAYGVGVPKVAFDTATEPDLLDDLLGLAGEVPGVARLSGPLDRFLTTSGASPRRHRFVFGVLAAVLAGLAFDVWHALVEGPWASPAVLVLFGGLAGIGVLGGYLLTLGPLRLIRAAS